MTIDGVNINTMGLFLVEVTGLYNKPGRKQILPEPGTDAKDIKFQSREIKVKLSGSFATMAALKTGIETLKTALRGRVVFAFINYSETVTGYVISGARIDVDLLMVTINFEITE